MRERPLLCLDPSSAEHGPASRVFLLEGSKVRAWRLIGSVDPRRNPVAAATAAWELSQTGAGNWDAVLFPVTNGPMSRNLALSIASALAPDSIYVPKGSGLAELGWPVGAEEVDLPAEVPSMVLEAQRRARWIEMLESADDHEVDLCSVSVLGSRLGSGRRTDLPEWPGWAEVSGSVLHLVGDMEASDQEVVRFLNMTHASRVSALRSDAYKGLVCSFANQAGDDFGIGVVTSFDPQRFLMRVKSTAVAPAPVRVLKIGTLRLDEDGRELEDLKPWTV